MKAVILAAGMGARLAPLTNDRPKPMVPVAGKPILFRTLDRLRAAGLADRDIAIVTGYREDVIRDALTADGRRIALITNPKYDVWNNFWSLYVAREFVGGDDFLQIDGDLLFDGDVIPRMLAAQGPAGLAVDVRPDLDDETMKVQTDASGHICAVSKKLDSQVSLGEYVGVTRLDAPVGRLVFEDLAAFERAGLTHEYYDHSYHRLAQRGEGPFHVIDISDCTTLEIDDLNDLRRAEELCARERLAG